MASNINTTDIDAEYPVAGVDNDSQGFRDNFDTIKDNFIAAKAEIEDLQDNTAKLNAANDFNGNDVQEANLIATTEEVNNLGNVTSATDISFADGHYHIVNVGANVTLTLTGWPATGKVAKMRVVVKAANTVTPYTVTWSASGGGIIKRNQALLPDSSLAFPSPFVVSSTIDPLIVDFWTDDAGTVVYANYVGEFV